jgi:hypothetical protein
LSVSGMIGSPAYGAAASMVTLRSSLADLATVTHPLSVSGMIASPAYEALTSLGTLRSSLADLATFRHPLSVSGMIGSPAYEAVTSMEALRSSLFAAWTLIAPLDLPDTPLETAQGGIDLLDAEADELAHRLEAIGLVLVRPIFGAADAARSDSLDRWTHFCSSARKILDGLLNRFAARRDPSLLVWVRSNRPDLLNQNGLATPLGRFVYALRHVQLDRDTGQKAAALAELYRRVCDGVHEPDCDNDDLRAEFRQLRSLAVWFVAVATSSAS